jgi:hypothetical protein
MGKPVEGDHMERLGVKWACNSSKADRKEVGLDDVKLINVAQDREKELLL